MKIYTRMGDGGETSLPGGRRLPKTEDIFELLGNLDETNATIGLAASFIIDDTRLKNFPTKQLYDVQSNLLALGACIAEEEPQKSKALQRLDKSTDTLESQIDAWDKQLPPLKNFILPEGTSGAAALHLARTLIRRSERSFHALNFPRELTPAGRYLNRLSDYFFQAARFLNHLGNHQEQVWKG
jgi:cob(I)alamin adenosyltransferase